MPLNVFPTITKPSLSPGAEVEVGQPTLATPVAPFGGEDHEVEGVDRLHLQPGCPRRPAS